MMFRKETEERNERIPDEQAMQDVMALLDDWNVPEPSTWFDARMMARFREEQSRPPESWLARVRDRFELGNASYRPILAGAMAFALLVGGGSYFTLVQPMQHTVTPASATLQDLQVLDNNDQAIQQMDQLLDGSSDSTSGNDSAL